MAKKLPNFLFILLLALAFFLRLFLIFKREPAGDEIYGLLLAKANFVDIWLGTFSDTNPPFYFLFLHLLSLAFRLDLSIFVLRLISLVFGLLGSVSIFYLAKLVSGRRLAKGAFLLSLFLTSHLSSKSLLLFIDNWGYLHYLDPIVFWFKELARWLQTPLYINYRPAASHRYFGILSFQPSCFRTQFPTNLLPCFNYCPIQRLRSEAFQKADSLGAFSSFYFCQFDHFFSIFKLVFHF